MVKTLVYLSGEAFPRLCTGGRLLWLGPRGAGVHLHEPGAVSESFCDEMDDGDYQTVQGRDPAQWCPPMPKGVRIVSVMDL